MFAPAGSPAVCPCVEAQPIAGPSRRGAGSLGAIAATTLGVAAGAAAFGAWPVMPFAGLEVALVAFAFRVLGPPRRGFRAARDRRARGAGVEARDAGGSSRFVAHRPWARVVMQDAAARCTLRLAYAGRTVPFGRMLSDEGRRRLAESSAAGCPSPRTNEKLVQQRSRHASETPARPVALAIAALAAAAALADYAVDILPPASPMAQEIYDLHWAILWVCVVIFFVVFGAMFWSIFKHRRSVGAKAAQFHENTTVEVIWTVIPLRRAGRHGLARHQDDAGDEGRLQRRPHDQGDGLPVALGVRLPAGRRAVQLQPLHAARPDRGVQRGRARRRTRTTCSRWTARWWCRSARRCACSSPPTT